VGLTRALAVLTSEPARVIGSALGTLQASVGQLVEGGIGDVCVFDLRTPWTVTPQRLRSQGRHTPFAGHELPAAVRWTLVGGQLAYEAEPR
jgi:dihydroorotase